MSTLKSIGRTRLSSRLLLAGFGLVVLTAGCSGDSQNAVAATTDGGAPSTEATSTTASTTTSTTATSTTTTTAVAVPTFPLEGRVFGFDGSPMGAATVRVGGEDLITAEDGLFIFEAIPAGAIEISRPGYHPIVVEWDGSERVVPVTMEPFVARTLRAAGNIARDDEKFQELLDLAARTSVNALVFDTKKEGGGVLYDTSVQEAHQIGAVLGTYDPVERIAQAKAAGLYTITRVVSFEDPIRVEQRPEYKLAGKWVDMTNPETWEYPLALGVEACELGFDEIQFDYVRFPTGQASVVSAKTRPTTGAERTATIAAFLTEARDRIHPLGCAVAADIFAIVLSAPNDQGIGQRPEDLSGIVDVISPMIYPSHYSDGWLGFADPNDYPGEVTADALDSGIPRVFGGTIVRPWLQAFSWTDAEILESIGAAERRGLGWMLWQASGNYDDGFLPDEDAASGAAEES
jgi:hypothetical protein